MKFAFPGGGRFKARARFSDGLRKRQDRTFARRQKNGPVSGQSRINAFLGKLRDNIEYTA